MISLGCPPRSFDIDLGAMLPCLAASEQGQPCSNKLRLTAAQDQDQEVPVGCARMRGFSEQPNNVRG